MLLWYMQVAREYAAMSDKRRQAQPSRARPTPVVQTEQEVLAEVVGQAPANPAPSPLLHSITPNDQPSEREQQLEYALRHVEAELRVAEQGRDAFLSAMSHELRTPLNAIMGFAEMIKNGVHGPLGNPTYREYVEHIHDSGGELLSKINDLLAIGSMSANAYDMNETVFTLSELLAEAISVHSHAAFSKHLQIRLDAPEVIELAADRTQLLCALAHFLSNAVQHSQEGKEIVIAARIQPDEGLILSVRDQGDGIAPQQLALIREALQREASYFAVQGGGIGIGLALASELANRHGGRIMIDSMRHRGTVTSIILPKERVVKGMPAKRKGLRG